MWKKILILFLAVMMVLSFAACDNKEDSASDDTKQKDTTEEKDAFSGLASADYARLMQSQNFYMTYTMYTMGMDFEGSQAVSDDIIASKVNIYDKVMFTILDDNMMYDIDSENKTYTVTELSEEELSTYKTDYANIVYVSSGNSTIASLVDAGVDTASYDYDEYVIDVDLSAMDEENLAALQEAGIDTDGNITIRYYIKDDGSLYAITCAIMDVETVMLVNELTDKVPGNMLEIPADYLKVEAAE